MPKFSMPLPSHCVFICHKTNIFIFRRIYVNYINIIDSLTFKFNFIFLNVNNFTFIVLKNDSQTFITKLAYAEQIVIKPFNQQNIINRTGRVFTYLPLSNDFTFLFSTKNHLTTIFDFQIRELFFVSSHVP